MQYQGNVPFEKALISNKIKQSGGELRLFYIAILATMAIFLSIAEHMIPKPLPWMRIGLSNAITLYAFTVLKPKEITILIAARVLATSILIGSFLSVAFFLSFTGAVSSFIVMYFIYKLFGRFFSFIGISILGACTSNFSQLMLLNMLFINSRISFYFLPFIFLFAFIGGIISGTFAEFLKENI